uniref:Uncharacterized protein n=1 Tax=Brassica oleracea TaxID=3712 RepID=A0A3P6EW80_BRAOL|nr:unnamed protein product [Brassica oleracea]
MGKEGSYMEYGRSTSNNKEDPTVIDFHPGTPYNQRYPSNATTSFQSSFSDVPCLNQKQNRPRSRLAPRQARVLERAQICNQNTAELFTDDNDNIYEAEETYEDDGDQIEDFSHDREKDEGYFAADGNFVEYVSIRDKKVKVEIKHWFNALGS